VSVPAVSSTPRSYIRFTSASSLGHCARACRYCSAVQSAVLLRRANPAQSYKSRVHGDVMLDQRRNHFSHSGGVDIQVLQPVDAAEHARPVRDACGGRYSGDQGAA
jgi:hypothetical protein